MSLEFRILMFIFSTVVQQQQIANAKRRQEESMDKMRGFEFSVEGEAYPLPVLYGRNIIAGARVYHNVRSSYSHADADSSAIVFQSNMEEDISGSKNEYLYVQQALCQGKINDVIDWVLDDQKSDTKELKHGQRIHVYKEGTIADPMMVANFTERQNSIFTDVPYASMVFRLNREDAQYSQGIPNLQFFVEGRTIKDIINTNGAFSLSEEEVYSNNPALVLLDYLTSETYGRGLSFDKIDLESFYNAKVICNRIVQTDVKVDGTYWNKKEIGKRDLPLYEANLIIDTTKSIRENVTSILGTMGDANLIWTNGVYKLMLEYPSTLEELNEIVIAEISEEDIVEDNIEVTYPSASERLNFCTVTFEDESEDFKSNTASWPLKTGGVYSSFLINDNQVPLETSLNIPGITDQYHALAKAEELVRLSRTNVIYKFKVTIRSTLFEPGDIIIVNAPSVSINNEYLKIKEIKFSEDGTADITAVKYDYTVLAWNAKDDQIVNPRNNYDFQVTAPTNVVLVPNETGNSAFGIGRLEWDYPENEYAASFSIYYSIDTNPTRKVYLGQSIDTNFDISNLRTNIYTFYVKATNSLRADSTSTASQAYNLSPQAPLNITFAPNDDGIYEAGSGTLSWSTVPDSFFRRFLIEYSVSGSPTIKKLGLTSDNNFVVDLGVGSYDFYIRTESFSGELSQRSNLENTSISIPKPSVVEFEANNFLNQTQSLVLGTLSWVEPLDYVPFRYIVEYRLPSANTYKRLGNSTTNTFEVSGLDLGSYVFSVRTESVRGLLSERVESISNLITVPEVTNLAFTRNTTNNITAGVGTLTWTAPINYKVSSYIVSFSYLDNNVKIQLGRTKTEAFTIKGMGAGNYTFIVEVESLSGALSQTTSLTQVINTSSVSELSFYNDEADLATNSSGYLSWSLALESSFAKFIIEYKKSTSNIYKYLGETTDTIYVLPELKPDIYDFSVTAVDINNIQSDKLKLSDQSISIDTVSNIVFIKNTSKRIDLGSGKLQWIVPPNFSVKEYIVEYRENNDPVGEYTLIGTASSNSITVPRLEAGSYYFYISTVSRDGFTSSKLRSDLEKIAIDGVTGVNFTPNQSTENTNSLGVLNWVMASDSKPKHFIIEYKTALEELLDMPGDNTAFKPIGITTNNSIDITELKQGDYVFSLISESNTGIKSERFISGVISITQNKPTSITFTVNSTASKLDGNGVLSWVAPEGLLTKSYIIEYRIDGTEDYVYVGTTTNTTYIINSIDSDIEYEFSVKAVGYSGEESLRGLSPLYNFSVPTVIDVIYTNNEETIDFGSGVLSWTEPTNYAVRNYIIEYSEVGENAWKQIGKTTRTSFVIDNLLIGNYDFAVSVESYSLDVSLQNTLLDVFIDDGSDEIPGIELSEILVENKDNITTSLIVKVIPAHHPLAVSYEVEYQRNGDTEWQSIANAAKGEGVEPVYVYINSVIDLLTYTVRARTISGLNTRSEWATTSKIVIGKTAPPAAPIELNADVIGSNLMLSWDPVEDVDLSHYFITYSNDITTGVYASSFTIVDKVSRPATTTIVPALTGKYFIKSVDKSNNISLEATETVVTTNLNYIENLNTVLNLPQHPNFTGTRTSTVLKDVDGYLYLNAISNYTEGYYTFPTTTDLGAVYTSKLSAFLNMVRLDSSTGLFDSVLGTFDSRTGNFDGPDYPDDIDVKLEVRYRNTTSDTWSSWKRFLTTTVTTRYLQFRLKLVSEANGITPQIRELEVIIDMPDRSVNQSNISSGTTVYNVLYPNGAFKDVPSIGIAAQNMDSGDYYTITNSTVSGFSIVFKNNSNTIINRTFDYVAKGYGKVE